MKQTKTKVHEDSVCHNLAKSGQGGPGSTSCRLHDSLRQYTGCVTLPTDRIRRCKV